VPSLEEDLAARLAKGDEVVLATVIRLDGEPPSRTGAKLLMSRSATLAGTLGCSEFDAAALEDASRIADGGSCEPTATTSAPSRYTWSRTPRRRRWLCSARPRSRGL
jgi:xanthine/CO dehydrogenase XdhC/CoxF family maturation factor